MEHAVVEKSPKLRGRMDEELEVFIVEGSIGGLRGCQVIGV
jgi:hypothetical protein